MDEPRDYLDDLLTNAAPRDVVVTAEIEVELARMAIAAHTDRGRASTTRRHLSRAATIGIAAVIVVATAGAAAAAVTFGPWTEWAKPPVATTTYTVPSGATCERRFGSIAGEDPEMRAAVEDILASPDVFDKIDIDAAIRILRADPDMTRTEEDGTRTDTSFGTPDYLTPDDEYDQAFTLALNLVVLAELEKRGLGTDPAQWVGLSFDGETRCTGEQR